MTDATPVVGYDTCGAHNRGDRGGLCTRPSGWGTDHAGTGRCKLHGGSTPTHERSAQIELARRACDRLGIPVVVSPVESLLDAVFEASGNVEYLRSLVAQLPSHPDPDIIDVGEDGKRHYEHGEPGIYGRTYHVSGMPTGEAKPHVLVQMYNDERDRLARYRRDAIELKIEERRVQLEENRAIEVFRAVTTALSAMGLGDRFGEFRDHFAAALASGRSIPTSFGTSSPSA